MIEIDGSQGEGGGQVLRSALTCSMMTGQAVHLENIRSGRSKPGLQPQHLKAVDAAAAVCRAEVQGARLGSTRLDFSPGEIRTGRYHFDIGTAGSTSLVLQTIYLPLSTASSASTIIVTGGTHVPWAPCYHYLEVHWIPFIHHLGFDMKISLEEAGFYPQGGGRVTLTVRPSREIAPLQLTQRGELLSVEGISAVANLDVSIADRQKRWAHGRLNKQFPEMRIQKTQLHSRFKGTMLLLAATFKSEHKSVPASCCYFGLGERGKPAERVADEAVDALIAYLDGSGAIDQYLADQLLLPLSFATGKSVYSTSRITRHLLTNAQVIGAFGAAKIVIDAEIDSPGTVLVNPAGCPQSPSGEPAR